MFLVLEFCSVSSNHITDFLENWLLKTLAEWKSRLRGWGYEPVICSVDTNQGLDTLHFLLRNQTTVIVGPSGVGKSSLINALRGTKNVLADDNGFEPVGLPPLFRTTVLLFLCLH